MWRAPHGDWCGAAPPPNCTRTATLSRRSHDGMERTAPRAHPHEQARWKTAAVVWRARCRPAQPYRLTACGELSRPVASTSPAPPLCNPLHLLPAAASTRWPLAVSDAQGAGPSAGARATVMVSARAGGHREHERLYAAAHAQQQQQKGRPPCALRRLPPNPQHQHSPQHSLSASPVSYREQHVPRRVKHSAPRSPYSPLPLALCTLARRRLAVHWAAASPRATRQQRAHDGGAADRRRRLLSRGVPESSRSADPRPLATCHCHLPPATSAALRRRPPPQLPPPLLACCCAPALPRPRLLARAGSPPASCAVRASARAEPSVRSVLALCPPARASALKLPRALPLPPRPQHRAPLAAARPRRGSTSLQDAPSTSAAADHAVVGRRGGQQR